MVKSTGQFDKYFYLVMSLLIAVVVVYGFSQTVRQHLFHATPPRPLLLYVHAAVFSGWVAVFILQSALVRTHNLRLHRLLGWLSVALGVAIPVLGVPPPSLWHASICSTFIRPTMRPASSFLSST